MKGLTVMILKDLRMGTHVNDIVMKYKTISSSAVYKIAKRNNIQLPSPECLTEEEKKDHKKQTDATQNIKKMQLKKEREFKFERPDIPMPELPTVAMESKGLGACNLSWVYATSQKRSSTKEHIETQFKFGLNSSILR